MRASSRRCGRVNSDLELSTWLPLLRVDGCPARLLKEVSDFSQLPPVR